MSEYKERRNAIRINPFFFYCSTLFCIFCMVVLTRSDFNFEVLPSFTFLDNLTYLLDPLIVYFVSCILLIIQITLYFYYTNINFLENKKDILGISIIALFVINYYIIIKFSEKLSYLVLIVASIILIGFQIFIITFLYRKYPEKFTPFLTGLLIVLVLILVSLFIELILKPSLHYVRPPLNYQKGESWLIKLLIGEDKREGLTSCPSGFALRQIFIYLTSLILLNQNPGTIFTKKKIEKFYFLFKLDSQTLNYFQKHNLTVLILQSIFLLYIFFSRVYRGSHTLFDIGVSLGSGVYSYWVLFCAFLKLKGIEIKHIPDIHYVSFVFIPLIFFYSRSAVTWTALSFLIITFLAIMYMVPFSKKIKGESK
jgi:hypothetical protein